MGPAQCRGNRHYDDAGGAFGQSVQCVRARSKDLGMRRHPLSRYHIQRGQQQGRVRNIQETAESGKGGEQSLGLFAAIRNENLLPASGTVEQGRVSGLRGESEAGKTEDTGVSCIETLNERLQPRAARKS